MHIINSIGEKIDSHTCKIMIQNIAERGIISYDAAKLILCAISERSYVKIPIELREQLRATLFKNLLLTQL